MRGFGTVCMIALCLLGCSNFDVLPHPGQPYAVILDPGESFTVVAVDGKPPERAHHWLHTVVPSVVVKPGVHVVTVKLDSPLSNETEPRIETISGSFEDGKGYGLELRDGKFAFVERAQLRSGRFRSKEKHDVEAVARVGLIYGQSFEPSDEGKQLILCGELPDDNPQKRFEVLLVTLQPATPPSPKTIVPSRADGTQ